MTGDQDDVLAARHRQRYDTAVEVRDGLHAEVIAEANARRDQVLEAIEALRVGRLSAKDARSGLRDIIADHGRLMEQHTEIESTDDHLAEFEEKDPAEHQADIMRRFPGLNRSNPEFVAMMGEAGRLPGGRVDAGAGTWGVVRQVDRAQLDADQDALVRALEGRAPSSGRPRVGGEWR